MPDRSFGSLGSLLTMFFLVARRLEIGWKYKRFQRALTPSCERLETCAPIHGQSERSLLIPEMPWLHSVDASSWARAGSPLGVLSYVPTNPEVGRLASWILVGLQRRWWNGKAQPSNKTKRKTSGLLDADRCGSLYITSKSTVSGPPASTRFLRPSPIQRLNFVRAKSA